MGFFGGGGGFFSNPFKSIGNVITSVVGGVTNALTGGGSGNPLKEIGGAIVGSVNAITGEEPKKQVTANQVPQSQAQAQSEADGGTPTAYASQGSKTAGSAASLSSSQQAVNQTAGSGTMLTGNSGVDPNALELGRKTLLGG